MIQFTYQEDRTRAATFDRTFKRIEEDIDDFRWVWPAVAQEFKAIVDLGFQTEGSANESGKWAPLTPAYKQWKEVHYPGMPILQATGHMRESIIDFEAGDHVYRPEPKQLQIGTKTPYAIYHQRGTPKMRARPIISMNAGSKLRIQKAIQRQLVAYIRRQGFQVGAIAA